MVVTLRAMPGEALTPWLDLSNAHYEAERIANGDSPDQAAQKAAESRQQYFPGDRPRPPHVVFQVMADDAVGYAAEPDDGAHPVGVLWIGPLDDARPTEWWVFDVEIDEPFRGRGFGRQAMLLAESAARERGATKLGLNVFGTNTVAQQLYRSLDYTTTAINMWKALEQ